MAGAQVGVEKQISAIRTEVRLIDKNAATYDKKIRNLEGISLEGTEATYFVSGGGLKKIVAKIYGEMYRATAELYFSGEEIIFAFQRVERYDRGIGASVTPKVVKTEEKRLYRSGRKTIRILSGKAELKTDNIEFTETEYELIELADALKAGLGQ